MSFEARMRTEDGVPVLGLHGEIDGAADDVLNHAYTTATQGDPKRILLDFTHVSYINSTGIALIVQLLAEARRSARSLYATGLSDHYKEIFEITRLSDFVTIVDDEADAFSSEAPT